jgi:integrase
VCSTAACWSRARRVSRVPFPGMRASGVKIQDLWYSSTDGKADLSRPTSRKGRGKRYRVTLIDLQGHITTEHHATKKAAEDRQKELSAKLVTGTYASPSAGRVAFEDVAEDWYTTKSIKVGAKTLEGYRSLLDTHVLPKWENTPVGNITWKAIQRWIAELKNTDTANRDGKLSASRVLQAYHVFRAVLGHAVKSKMLATNPAADIDLPRKPTPDPRYLTHDQVSELAAECGEHDVMVLVLAYCGLRWGEAIALTRGDVDFERARIAIRAAVTRTGRKYALGPTKTHETRSVPVPATVLKLLCDRIEARPADKLVFPGSLGYMRSHELRRVFDPAATKIGVPGLVPHELRHTCASLAIRSAGASIKAVQALLGHKTATMTLDRYGSLYDSDLDAVALRLDTECAYPPRTAA